MAKQRLTNSEIAVGLLLIFTAVVVLAASVLEILGY